MKKNFYIIALLLAIYGCSNNYPPKPRGYFRIDFPVKKYQFFDSACPFTFEYPVYGTIEKDKSPNAEPCWMNIDFNRYNAKIHLSYKSVNKSATGLIEDSHILAYKHTIKADAIDEEIINDSTRNMYGILYDIKGNAASSVQFYVTDSLKHFLRGSLYFNVTPDKDSLAPAIEFFRKDIIRLIETIKWKKGSIQN